MFQDQESRAWPAFAALFVLLLAAVQFAIVAPTPFVSEDWTHLAAAREVPTLADALSPEREPMRPLQHGYFWILSRSGLDPAAPDAALIARVPAFLLHLLACAALYALARACGATKRTAAIACALFACAPNVKSLAWPAAIGSPGRVAFELAALACFAWQARERRFLRGAAGLVLFACALGFHESAFLAPLVLVLWLVAGDARGVRAGLASLRIALRDPFLLAFLFGGALHLVQLSLRAQRHHGLKDFDALPANVAKAALALAPEPLRAAAIDGLRGEHAWIGTALGCAVVLAVLAAFAYALRRGGPARFASLAIAADLGLAVLGVGFVQRYAYFSSAILALTLAVIAQAKPRSATSFAASLLALAWAIDSFVDAREYRAAGAIVSEVVDGARAARERSGTAPIAVVDAPDMAGAEEDVPLFNWGLDLVLAAHGIDGPWLLWRTREFRTNSNVERVDADALERAAREGTPRLLVYDAVLQRLVLR